MSNSNKYYTQADIEKYLNGGMTAKEMHAMEYAALDDPMLADAIDGYRDANKEETKKHLSEIKDYFLNTSDKAKVIAMPPAKTKWWRGMAAAAAIIGVMLASWFLFLHKDGQKENVAQSIAVEKPVDSLKKQEPESRDVTVEPDSEKQQLVEKNSASVTKQNVQVQSLSTKKSDVAEDKVLMPQPQIAAATPKPAPVALANTDEQKNLGALSYRKVAAPIASERRTVSDSQIITHKETLALQGKVAGLSVDKTNYDTIGKSNATAYSLNDVTIAGYGVSKKRKSNNYASASAVRVRGNQSLPAENPLYIIDGKVIPAAIFRTLQPSEIKNVLVLKDSVAAALYGSRATNGVIVVTTFEHNPEPQNGWNNFYTNLYKVTGIGKGAANKVLRISFIVEKGSPVNFSIIEAPNAAIAQNVIDAIKDTKWVVKNSLYNKVELALRVE